jgi:hypothetical protein
MRLLLKKQIYQRENVLRAIEAYSTIAAISFTEDEMNWICDFVRTEYEQSLTVKEFENYVIGLEG